MQIRVKKLVQNKIVRLESLGDVKEIFLNEDLMHPERESVSLCFKGNNSSGIVDLSPAEIEKLYRTVQDRMHLIKGFKRLSGSGAVLL